MDVTSRLFEVLLEPSPRGYFTVDARATYFGMLRWICAALDSFIYRAAIGIRIGAGPRWWRSRALTGALG